MPDFTFENQYSGQLVAGVDEAGRGPMAGPVMAAAVILRPEYLDNDLCTQIDDSKKLSAKKRELLYQQITKNHHWAIGIATVEEIDEYNILEATKMACKRAVADLIVIPEFVLVDGNMKFDDGRFRSIIKGDQISLSIAAASIIAKVARDKIMSILSGSYSNYDWEQNKGYGTKKHMAAIMEFGLTCHHRLSFCKKLSIF